VSAPTRPSATDTIDAAWRLFEEDGRLPLVRYTALVPVAGTTEKRAEDVWVLWVCRLEDQFVICDLGDYIEPVGDLQLVETVVRRWRNTVHLTGVKEAA
jgi:hypothetical protein